MRKHEYWLKVTLCSSCLFVVLFGFVLRDLMNTLHLNNDSLMKCFYQEYNVHMCLQVYMCVCVSECVCVCVCVSVCVCV